MAERDKLVYIVVDEANRPTSLGAFDEGDTISSGTLPNNVRTAVEDVDTLNTRVDNLDTSVGDLSTAIDSIVVGAVDASVLAAAQFVTDSSGDLVDTSNTVVTLNTRVDNLDTSVGDLSTAIDAIVVGEIDASVLAAAQFVTDSSGDIIDTSNAVVTLDTRVGNVETSTADLSTYINSNESSWAAGLDAGTLADITAVSTVVSNASGDNSNIVTSYGAYSGAAIGIQYANNTFSGAGAPKVNINMGGKTINNAAQVNSTQVKANFLSSNGNAAILLQENINANNQDITGIGTLSVTGNITVTGTVDGVDISIRDAYLTSLATSSEELSGAITTLDGTVTNIEGSTISLSSYINSNEATWNAGAAGIDPDLLADITAVSTVVTTTSGSNEDIVTSYGPFSGDATGVSAAAAVFTSVNGSTAVLKKSIDVGNNNLTGVNTFGATTANITTGNITNGNITNGNITNNLIVTGGVSAGPLSAAGSILSTGLIKSNTSLQSLGNIACVNNISTTTGDIVATAGDIVATAGDVTANGVSVTGLDGRVTTNEGNITTLQTDVAPVTDLVTAYGPVSGAASGVSGAAAVFASVNGTTAVINRNLDFNTKTITNAGTINGISVTALDAAITTNTDNIANNTADIAALQASDSFPVTSLNTTLNANSNNITNAASVQTETLTATGTDIQVSKDLNLNSNDITNAGSIAGTSVSVATVNTDILNATGTDIQVSQDLDLDSNNITNAGSVQTETLTATGTDIRVSKNLDLITDNKILYTRNLYSTANLTASSAGILGIASTGNIVFNNGTPFTANDFGACCFNWNTNYDDAQTYDTVGWDATKTIVDNNVTGIVGTTSDGFGSSGIRLAGSIYSIDQGSPPVTNNILKYNNNTVQWELGSLAFEVDGGTGVATPVSEVTSFNFAAANLDIQSNLNVSSPSGTVTFGTQQTFTPSSNTFSTRNILIGNELSSGPECVVNLEGSTIWASGSVLSAGSGCDITLRGDKFFYGPTNIYGPLGTDLDLDGNNLIDVNNVTTANAPLTLQVTGSVTAGNLNIKNTATGIGTSGNIDMEAIGDITLSSPNTVSIEADTVNLDGTGLFGLSGGAVRIDGTSTFVTIDANAYLNITAGTNLNLNSADNGTQSVNIDGCPFPNPFYQVRANTGLNINSAANVAVTFSAVDVSGGGKVASHYSSDFGTTPTSFQVDTAGTYEVSFNIMVYDPAATVAQRSTHIAQITKNGTVIGPGAIGYVRSNSGSNEASYNMNGYIIELASGDDIGVNFERVATTTSTTEILPGYDHILTIKRIG